MAQSKTIFSLSYGSYFGGACIITIEKQDEDSDLCIIKGCNGYFYNAEFSIKKDSIDSIRETLDKVKQWNKEYKCPEDILDGFDWEVEFVTGKRRISRSGYMAYPENYNEVMQELIMFIEKLKKDELSSEDLFPPLDPFETEGYFVPIGEKVIKKEHYRKCDFKPQNKVVEWSRLKENGEAVTNNMNMGHNETGIELNSILRSIKDDDFFLEFIFDYCESTKDRERLLDYIRSGHADRKEVLLMASQIGIESGNVEGELIEDEV